MHKLHVDYTPLLKNTNVADRTNQNMTNDELLKCHCWTFSTRLKFRLLGRLEFNLPNNDGLCIGTYALSKDKGTWSIYCENKNVNASGILKWNHNEGSVSGNGKDNKGKKIKFKISSRDWFL